MRPMRIGPSGRGWIAQVSNFEFEFKKHLMEEVYLCKELPELHLHKQPMGQNQNKDKK